MNNPFEEIFKRLENIEKMIAPFTGVQPEERQDGKEPVLVKISVASGITGYSVNYLYHLASTALIPISLSVLFSLTWLRSNLYSNLFPFAAFIESASARAVPDRKSVV